MHHTFIAEKRQKWVFLILLVVLLVVVRLPELDDRLDNDSGANAFFARQMIRGETLYDTFHPTHHLPGIYYTFETAFRLFGDNPIAPKLFLFPWALACAVLLYVMGSIYFDRQTGLLAAIFFVLVSSQRWVAGQTVEIEHFANLPLIAGFFLLIILLHKRASAWQFVWLGMLGAVSFLYKVIFVGPLLVAGICILLVAWILRREPRSWKTMILRWSWIAVGFIAPVGIVAAYFASLGLWNRFLLVFELGFNYFKDPQVMNVSNLPPPFGYPIFWMSVNNLALLCFGLMGTYRLIRRSLPLRTMGDLTDLATALWLIFSLALTGLRGGGFPWYVLPAVPPLAFVASIEINAAYQRWKLSSERLANLGRGVSIALVIVLFLSSNYSMYRDYVMYKLSWISQASFLQRMNEEEFASQQIGNYLQANTNSDDFIYLWSHRVEIYYYADRVPPIDILWPSYVGVASSPDRIFDPRTKYIAVDKWDNLSRPEWLTVGLAADYELEAIIEGREIYRRRSP